MSISLTRILQQITGFNTFFQGPNASRSNGVVLEDSDTVTWSTDGQGNIQASAAGGSLSGPANEVYATPNGSTGSATLRALVPADLPVATVSAFGAVKPDGTTITVAAGVLTAVGGGAMQLIQEQTLSSAQSTLTFASIPQTFKHLLVIFSGVNQATNASAIGMSFNGDGSSVYGYVINQASNSGVAAFNGYAVTSMGIGAVAATSSGSFTVPNYSATTARVTAEGQSTAYLGAGIVYQRFSGYYVPATPAPVTSLTILFPNPFNTGSIFSLYGIS